MGYQSDCYAIHLPPVGGRPGRGLNGRVYDPWLGRFLSPDPFVQSPSYSQSYNRYSYCLNNPLRYTDPSGYTYKPDDWDKQPTGPIFFFYPGIMGPIGPGSGYHWSDPLRSEYGNFMLMNEQTFTGFYDQDTYNDIFNNVASGSINVTYTGQAAQSLYENIVNGMNIYAISAFSLNTLVSCFGELGPIEEASNGAIYFNNPTAGAYIGESEIIENRVPVSIGGSVDFGNYNISSGELKERLVDFADQTGYTITVVGGDRNAARNASVGGSKGSRHISGDAADIVVRGTSNRNVAIQAHNSGLFNTSIYYPNYSTPGALPPHVHVDLNPGHDNVLMIYKIVDSSNQYLPWNP
jgi:hypothetical protein